MNGIAVAAFMLLGPATAASAEVGLANIISDNMVLQRDARAAVWGYATPGERITLRFAGQTRSTTAEAKNIPPPPSEGAFMIDGRRKRHLLGETYPRSGDGRAMARWIIHLDPMKASMQGRILRVSGTQTIEVKNVLVGEVWFAAGQSNMSWGIKQRIKNRARAIEWSKNPLIRLTSPGYGGAQEERFGTPFKWDVCSPEVIKNHPANPFYFARKIQSELGVPVGIITAATGGALVESFTDLPTLKADPDYPGKYSKSIATWDKSPSIRRFPASMYHAMVRPCMPYTIRGAIWYQGENSIGDDYYYRDKLAAMITSWRGSWGCGDFSFYIAQLAGGPPNKTMDEDLQNYQPGFGWPEFRVTQSAVIKMVPNCDVACYIDIGESDDVHAYNKEEQGRRLALLALAHDYGRDTVFSGPRYKSHKMNGTSFIVTFDHAGRGLTAARMKAVVCDPPSRARKTKRLSEEWVVTIDENSKEELTGFWIMAYDKSVKKGGVHWRWPQLGVNKIVAGKARIISKDTIEVTTDEIVDPKQILGLRYNMSPQLTGNLYNLDGLPTLPFRTDSIKSGAQRRRERNKKQR